jgi:hypothetical protein
MGENDAHGGRTQWFAASDPRLPVRPPGRARRDGRRIEAPSGLADRARDLAMPRRVLWRGCGSCGEPGAGPRARGMWWSSAPSPHLAVPAVPTRFLRGEPLGIDFVLTVGVSYGSQQEIEHRQEKQLWHGEDQTPGDERLLSSAHNRPPVFCALAAPATCSSASAFRSYDRKWAWRGARGWPTRVPRSSPRPARRRGNCRAASPQRVPSPMRPRLRGSVDAHYHRFHACDPPLSMWCLRSVGVRYNGRRGRGRDAARPFWSGSRIHRRSTIGNRPHRDVGRPPSMTWAWPAHLMTNAG